VFIVSVIKVTHMLQFLHQMFNLFALLRDYPLKPATPLTNDDCLLQLVDCRESSTLIDHLLKGTSNSAIDWIQVRAVWGPHVRLDERDVLTPQVSRCVPGSVLRRAVLLQASVHDASATPAGCDSYFRQ